MLHLVSIDRTPFENPNDHIYAKMAFDGMYFYCCTGKSSEIYKLTIKGKLICCVDTKRTYYSLCFDCNENCFWAITFGCRSSIFKLSTCLREIGCISIPYPDRWYHNISYDAPGDHLLLCSGNLVVRISKSGFVLPLYNGEKNVHHEAAIQIFDSYLIGCKFQIGCPEILGILCSNYCFDYLTCMPKQFSLNSMCMGYRIGGCDTLFILAAQNYQYSYLLTYQIEQNKACEQSCQTLCCEPVNDDQMISISIDKMDVQADIMI